MNTCADAFSLGNSSAVPARRSGFRVPFGLRDGRAWAPSEVARGKACGCVCPGCGAALVAKAQTSRRRRPHFAHLTDTGCQTGRETGIHLRAKQLIAERRQLRVPAWDGNWIEMPNPPPASDADGHVHVRRSVSYPARHPALPKGDLESRFGA